MALMYDQHKDDDGFLYMAYSGENSMGHWLNTKGTTYRLSLMYFMFN